MYKQNLSVGHAFSIPADSSGSLSAVSWIFDSFFTRLLLSWPALPAIFDP